MSRGSTSAGFGPPIGLEGAGEVVARQASAQIALAVGGLDTNGVAVELEVELVPGAQIEGVAQLLGDDDLTLGAHAMSHTLKYNFRSAVETWRRWPGSLGGSLPPRPPPPSHAI